MTAILRDDQGKLVDGVVSTIYSSSVRQGEARTIRLACLFLQSLGLSNIQVLGLSLQASFAWIPRAANGVAHWLSRAHLYGVFPFDWVVDPLAVLSELLSVDVPL
ncbi:hypothetical protein ACSBR2_022570 [Camellia fascicularis]